MHFSPLMKKMVPNVVLRKTHMLAFALFIGSIVGAMPSPFALTGAVLFVFTYLSVYFYNDLIDYRKDRTHKYVPDEKLLARGYYTQEHYVSLLAFVSVAGITLTFLYDKALGLITALAILTNFVRTHVDSPFTRQALLVLVEILNFEAFWYALFGEVIPAHVLPVFVAYASAYAAAHAVYKHRKEDLRSAALRPGTVLLLALFTASVVLSAPFVLANPFHGAVLLVGTLIYAGTVVSRASPAGRLDDQMDTVFSAHTAALFATAIIFTVASLTLPSPALPSLPHYPAHVEVLLKSIDDYQYRVLTLFL